MSVLRTFETKLAGLVEGAFSRVFRSEVRPVEIARKLAREMEQHKAVSVSRTYVPNEYIVYLSPSDRERFAGYEEGLVRELSGHLLEHARSEKLDLLSRPRVMFETAEELKLGEFGIQARLVEPAEQTDAGAKQADFGHTMIYSTAERLSEPLQEQTDTVRQALLIAAGKKTVADPAGTTIGRSRQCGVVLDDPNISRCHAEINRLSEGWCIADLGSTNGVSINGQKIDAPTLLTDGDVIEVGSTQVTFSLV